MIDGFAEVGPRLLAGSLFWQTFHPARSIRYQTNDHPVVPGSSAGVLSLVIGVLFLTWPTLAELGLTLFIAVLFIVGGLIRLGVAWLGRFPAWGWVVYDGVLSVGLGVVIWVAWPESAMWVLGLLVGIDLLFKGWS